MQNFDELIADLDSGQLNTELTTALRDMLRALQHEANEGRAAEGEIDLKLKFKAAPNGMVKIKGTPKIKQPGPANVEDTRWIGEDGQLVASDPRQAKLPLKTVGANDAPEGPRPLKTPNRN